jgi:thiamine biosynthesis lipoprotein
MGTDWQVEASGCAPETLQEAEALVRAAEQRYSRFLPDSLLNRLNRDRWARDGELADLVCRALEFRASTGGAFDPAVGAAVIAAGYDRSIELLPTRGPIAVVANLQRPGVPVQGDVVRLDGPGLLDLGGIAKGWTVDRVGALLAENGARSYFVDGGGDLLLGGDRDEEELVELCTGGYRVGMRRGALASSSTLHRRWAVTGGSAHHIIDPASGLPADTDWVQTSVLAADATTADVLATSLLADARTALLALRTYGAEALLVAADGRCMMTPGLAQHLR